MSCSYGYVQQFLMPCPHVCAVIQKQEFYVPSMFHIRRHQLYNYYHSSSFEKSIAGELYRSLMNIVKVTRETCYHSSGKYKEIPVKDSMFYKQLPVFVPSLNVDTDQVLNLMLRIRYQTNNGKPVIKNTLGFYPNDSVSSNDEDVILPFHVDESEMKPASFGGSSDMNVHLSQDRVAMDDNLNATSMPPGRYYKEALPLFEEMVYSCSNDVQFNEMMHAMRVQHVKNQCAKGINAGFTDTRGGGASLFGEHNTNQRSVRRHKFTYERFGKR
jgi:hypothetical protein